MKPSIRLARPADLDAVVAIERAWKTAPGWSRAQFEAEFSNARSHFLIAELEGCIAGYAVFWAVAPEAQILDLAVDPKYCRQGVGRLLLKTVLEKAGLIGLKEATLEVRADNAAAAALYQAAGFAVVGRRPKFYNGAFDAVLMNRDLS